jgi:hypothetical protein
MGALVSCRVEQPSRATPEAVYDVLMDVPHWSNWMPTVSAASWEHPASIESGEGAVRRVRNFVFVTHDRVTAAKRPDHHAYSASVSFAFPVRDYRGDVRIEEQPNGCRIVWTLTCRSIIPFLDKTFERSLSRNYSRIAAALAQEAERRARA